MTKYGLFVGDFHCGHLVGLTPKDWHYRFHTNTGKRMKLHKIALELWDSFDKDLKSMPPLDFVVINGDMVEGKGSKSGGTELLTSTMKIQCDMAVAVIERIRKASKNIVKIYGTYGTPYHSATLGDDWEDVIADEAGFTKIGAHEWLEVNGLVFDIKHKIGSSSIPHGRHTAISKDGLWNLLWAERGMQPKADVIIRSHVHYFTHCGTSDKLCMTLPSLQGMGSKYGARECSGLVDWGMVLFKINSKDDYEWIPYIRKVKAQRARVVKL